MEELPARCDDVLVKGENVIDRREPAALERRWECAERRDFLLYAGVLELNERSSIREFHQEGFAPALVHERGFGLPGTPGEVWGWAPERSGVLSGTGGQSTG